MPNGILDLVVPVSGTNVASMVSRYAATVDDDSQDHKTDTGSDFHYAEDEFDLDRSAADPGREQGLIYFSIAFHPEELDNG